MATINKFTESAKRCYRVDRREIAYLKFILEAYDGLAVVSTLDPQGGIIVLHISPGCEPDVETILRDLNRDIMMEPAQPPIELKIED
jgi:Domain of unknown function (DUF4911)